MAIANKQEREARLLAEKQRDEQCIAFVRESELISGVGLEMLDDPATWTKPGTQKLHLEMARTISTPGGNVISVCPINSGLTNHKSQWFRTGTEGAMRNVVPDGKEVPGLIARLDQRIRLEIARLAASGSDEEKDQFAWQMHDMLICMHAFKACNGRTARLLLNHLRMHLNLPWFIVYDVKSAEYYAKLDDYKRTKYFGDLDGLRNIVLEDNEKVA